MSYLKYNCELDFTNAIDWQRSNAEILFAWLIKKTEWYATNHCDFWNVWFDNIFNLDTANDFGLSVWAIILNENAYGLIDVSPVDYPAFGFSVDRENFNNGNFATNSDVGCNFTTDQIRKMLKLKAFILHMSGSVHGDSNISINTSLDRIFGEDSIFCIDNRDMSFTYVVYDNEMDSLAIELYTRDLLPRPVGIEVDKVVNGNANQFGFGEGRANFNNGNFDTGVLIGN
ncbi:hypothetical protein KKJFFJLC_00054 [Vibrio phage vB_VpaS_PGB]|nr:hypothetical protein KKJFFJLC_00054 [Vibrio phage vB_VpaS_PGB]